MRHCDTLLHAACIVTQDEQRRVIEKASLAIDKGLVADVGPTAEMAQNCRPTRFCTSKTCSFCRASSTPTPTPP